MDRSHGVLLPEARPLRDALTRARDPATPGDALLAIAVDPFVVELRTDAANDPYVYMDYPGHHADLPARREAFLGALFSALARHPNAPPDLQELLARDGFGAELIHNPNAAPEVLDGLARAADGPRAGLASHPASPTSTLDVLAFEGVEPESVLRHRHASAAAREAAAFLLGSGVAGEETLRRIARHGRGRAPLTVARHPGTPADALMELVRRTPFPDLLDALIAHPNADAPLLRAVGRTLVARYGRPHSRTLYTEPGTYDPAQRRIRAILAHPACDPAVRALFAGIAPLVELPVPERRRLAADPHTDPALLTVLGLDVDRNVLHALAGNPGAPAGVLAGLAPRGRRSPYESHSFAGPLAANPGCPPEVLRRVYEYDAGRLHCGRLLLANPNTPADLREILASRLR
ncbi:hypothetical protein Val02_04920 [Virgisporangium aliadipatigenens]|uniref:Uncharacterized protein n=1 Tax=Virgisporangium aliadipatigenens TaxID=741659 RepID=A0A8J3YEM4_9ACTN|nr:hypothetical protein [Virgisporangium aliadipatigenens]GIJ43606.1 hypothetical protein Val02_04920 [Virgisporangium aliadipatigenens]